MTLTFQPEPFSLIAPELPSLLRAHHNEVEPAGHNIACAPNVPVYVALEQAGILWIITVRDEGELVGYLSMLICQGLHFAHVRTCQVESFYIRPEWRTGWRYLALFRRALALMRDFQVGKVYVVAKSHLDFSPVLRRLGLAQEEVVYTALL